MHKAQEFDILPPGVGKTLKAESLDGLTGTFPEKAMEKDRRKYPRQKVWLDAKITTSEDSDWSVVTDISIDGVQIQSPKAFPSGTKVVVSLDLPEKTLLSGTVHWVLDSHSGERRYYQIGVEIEAIILPEIKAIGFNEKAELLEEILSRIKIQEQG